jgi:hypothetical protein
VKSTQITISELTANPAGAVRAAERDGLRSVMRHGEAVVFMVSRNVMEGMLETIELQQNKELMGMVKKHKAGKVKFTRIPDED